MTALAWATPTRRAMRWRPLLAVASAIAMSCSRSRQLTRLRPASTSSSSSSAMIVAGATLALDDPAHSLDRGRAGRLCSSARPPDGVARSGSLGCLLVSIGWFASRFGSWSDLERGSSTGAPRSDRSRSPRTSRHASAARCSRHRGRGRSGGAGSCSWMSTSGTSRSRRLSHLARSAVGGRCAWGRSSPSSDASKLIPDLVNRSGGRWHKCSESRRAPGSAGAGHRRTRAGTTGKERSCSGLTMPFDRRAPRSVVAALLVDACCAGDSVRLR